MIPSLRRLYRTNLPEPFRRAVRALLFGSGPYSRGFFRSIDSSQGTSYPLMAASLVARYSPRSVVDVGCGTGGLLAELRRQGVPVLKGFEYHDEGRAMCRRHGLDVEYGDLSQPLAIPSGFDLCVCLEVAEHLPAGAAQQLVANLAAGPPTLIFSAATPGQGGHAHLNEQPAKYWVDKLAGAGMVRSEQETRDLSENWTASGVAIWFSKNVQVFRRA